MLLYRVVPELYGRDLSGRGAQLYGGRWNPKGMAAVYTAESAAQALLEYLPHFPETCAPPDLMLVTIETRAPLSVQEITEEDLPADWSAKPPVAATVLIGKEWLAARKNAALRVPSIMLPYGKAWNIILNPQHPEFSGMRIADMIPLPIDPRLVEKLGRRMK